MKIGNRVLGQMVLRIRRVVVEARPPRINVSHGGAEPRLKATMAERVVRRECVGKTRNTGKTFSGKRTQGGTGFSQEGVLVGHASRERQVGNELCGQG